MHSEDWPPARAQPAVCDSTLIAAAEASAGAPGRRLRAKRRVAYVKDDLIMCILQYIFLDTPKANEYDGGASAIRKINRRHSGSGRGRISSFDSGLARPGDRLARRQRAPAAGTELKNYLHSEGGLTAPDGVVLSKAAVERGKPLPSFCCAADSSLTSSDHSIFIAHATA